jgi:oxygen-independent coproporphyrinogen-3 oxidase
MRSQTVDDGAPEVHEPLRMTAEPAGLYVHLPFCVVRCAYCDFYSLVGQDDQARAYVDAVAAEIAAFPGRTGYRPALTTVYVGGGTPSHLPSGSLSRILDAIAGAFPLAKDAEISVEANPESAARAILEEFRRAGANRLSIGVQSFRPDLLAMMGRPHGPDAPRAAIDAAREAGMDNVSLDLIYGLPGQSVDDWRGDLETALALTPDHLSAYLLETDKDTPLARRLAQGELEEPSAETIESLFEATEDRLPRAGFTRYEVSNWSRPGRTCRHNLGYWTDRPYVGFGSSSHSYYLGRRRKCDLPAARYVEAVAKGEPTRADLDDGASSTRLAEALVTALRLADGADFDAIGARYGVDLWSRHAGNLDVLAARGWAHIDPPRVRLTVQGILWSLDALAPFVGDGEGDGAAAAARAARGAVPQ